MTLVISAYPNLFSNLSQANYYADVDGYCIGGLTRREDGTWLAEICSPSLTGGDEDDPECWSDVTVVYEGTDRLAAKATLKQKCEAGIASGWFAHITSRP